VLTLDRQFCAPSRLVVGLVIPAMPGALDDENGLAAGVGAPDRDRHADASRSPTIKGTLTRAVPAYHSPLGSDLVPRHANQFAIAAAAVRSADKHLGGQFVSGPSRLKTGTRPREFASGVRMPYIPQIPMPTRPTAMADSVRRRGRESDPRRCRSYGTPSTHKTFGRR
jgi:hypothetical protein